MTARPFALATAAVLLLAAAPEHLAARPMLEDNIDRPLRYQPDGTDFVITNGPDYFNRPLYGDNSAFRVDGGDRPEFSLFLPGRGGNLRLGVLVAGQAKWLDVAATIVARYRPGSMLYEITDPLLGDGATLRLTALTLPAGQGLIVRAETNGVPVTLVFAYGGANGDRGSRDGDIGTERVPVSEFFQLQPEYCRNDTFAISGTTFQMTFQNTVVYGVAPADARLAVADSNEWDSVLGLLATGGNQVELPVLAGQTSLSSGHPVYLALQELPQSGASAAPLAYASLPQTFADAEARREAIAGKVTADTPDPYINAATAAVCVAADGIWDDSAGVFEHGAVAWRRALLGWRGDYSADELGWFDREVRDITHWAGRQNTKPIGPVPTPDPTANYARDEPALHSNGDMSNSHYDMNLVFIDAVFRHLLWTGDLAFAKQMWPVIQAHLAWEQRLFRRPYGGDNLPLYEGYAAIWASDDLEYDGGGATHASAYNYFQNLMAARVAQLIGEDPAPYQKEAELISKAMRRELWLPDRGWYAEYRDWLGLQLPHTSPAVWSFYHAVDSLATTPEEAWQMSRYVDTQIPHIPVRGPGVPEGYFTISTTDWMPYTWSLNNVVMAESAHTALAYWQANRGDEAFKLFKGCLLDSMYLGQCPGNAGMTTFYDVYRGESQRDFGDAVGTVSRALVEGLFGVRPDALAGVLLISPGFPASWDHVNFHHPSVDYTYHADGPVEIKNIVNSTFDTASPRAPTISQTQTIITKGFAETYTVTPRFPVPMSLRLQAPARYEGISNITVNGQFVKWAPVENAVGQARIQIDFPPASHFEVHIIWVGQPLSPPAAPAIVALGGKFHVPFGAVTPLGFDDPQAALNGYQVTKQAFDATAVGLTGNRTVFLQVQQGQMRWWAPLTFEIRPPYDMQAADRQDSAHLRFTLRNNTDTACDQDAVVHIGAVTRNIHLTIPAFGTSPEIALDADGLFPGVNDVVIDLGGNRTIEGYLTNWHLNVDPAKTHLDPVDMSASFNDRVTQIFLNQYFTPRSPFCSLSIPLQGFGTWTAPTATFNVDDSGLRDVAARDGGITLPEGVTFRTPGPDGSKNILFTSQWDLYPREASVPLTGKAAHAYLLMAGSTNPMQSRLDNGEVVVTYADGTTMRLPLQNPINWWPIDQDYFIDDFAFRRTEAMPPRVSLSTGEVRVVDAADFKGQGAKYRSGGAATVLDLPLDPTKDLKSITVRTLANDVVIGLMAVTLAR